MISDILKPLDYYRENKKKFNRKYNYFWKRIAGPECVGFCSTIFHDFYNIWKADHKKEKPSCNDFARYYFSHVNPNDDQDACKWSSSKNYGRSVRQLTSLARRYMEMCGDDSITLEEYFDDIVNHAIVETFSGQMREVMLKEKYEENGFIVEHLSGKWDRQYGVDTVIKNKNGIILEYIQCKPISAFIGTHNKSLIDDRKTFYTKENDKKKECMKLNYPYYPTRFILYNSDKPGKWCGIGDKKSFLLEELCDRDGMPLHDISDFVYFS